jgi:hypothetical protein
MPNKDFLSKAVSRGWSVWCAGGYGVRGTGRSVAASSGVEHHLCRLPTCPCRCHRKRLGRGRWCEDGSFSITCYECGGMSRYRGLSRNGMPRSRQLLERGWVNTSWVPGRGNSQKSQNAIRWRHIRCDAEAYRKSTGADGGHGSFGGSQSDNDEQT